MKTLKSKIIVFLTVIMAFCGILFAIFVSTSQTANAAGERGTYYSCESTVRIHDPNPQAYGEVSFDYLLEDVDAEHCINAVWIDNLEFTVDSEPTPEYRGTAFAASTSAAFNAPVEDDYDVVSFDYMLIEPSNTLNIYLTGSEKYGTLYYGTYNFVGNGTLNNGNPNNAITITPVGDGYYHVTMEIAGLGRTGGSNNLEKKPAHIYTLRIHQSYTNGDGYIDNIEFRKYDRGEKFTVGTVKAIVADEQYVNYDKLTFEYKLEQADAEHKLSICFLDSTGSKYYGYYNFVGNGTLDNANPNNAITISAVGDGYYRVTVNFAGLGRTGNANNLDGKPDDVYQLYIHGSWSNSNAYIDNVSFIKYAVPEMVAGAFVRLNEPYGIRFIATIPVNGYDADAEYGMIIIPNDYIATYGLDGDYVAQLEEQEVAFRKYGCTPVLNGENYEIKASLVGILESNLTREFIGIAFKEKGGVRTYSAINDNVRSITDVSKKAIFDTERYNALGSEEQTFLQTTVGVVTDGGVENIEYRLSSQASISQVIEFYYKKSVEGDIKFAVINDADWNTGYYGYYTIDNTNTSLTPGVQVSPVGTNWTYVPASDNLSSIDQWYKVIVDFSKLPTHSLCSGDVSGYTYFDLLYFPKNRQTAEFELLGATARDGQLDDGAYYMKGNNSSTTYSYNFDESISYENLASLTYYVKQVSNIGGNVLKLQVKGTGEYVNINTNTITSNKAYATVESVTTGEYAGWLKVTYDFTAKTLNSNLTGFYTRWNEGEFLVSGFMTEYT